MAIAVGNPAKLRGSLKVSRKPVTQTKNVTPLQGSDIGQNPAKVNPQSHGFEGAVIKKLFGKKKSAK